MSHVTIDPLASARGHVAVPGDKSASHRALILSALADGESRLHGLSPGEDVRGTARLVSRLGATVLDGDVGVVRGPSEGLRPTTDPLDCGNSGTTMRLLAGVVAGVPGRHTLVGDPSLMRRPMDRVARPLREMGADVTGSGERETAPLRVIGRRPLRPIDFRVPIPSAQVKSAVLLAGLVAEGDTVIRESVRTRTTTEDMLRIAGIRVSSEDDGAGRVVVLRPGRPRPVDWVVPGDPSQAAFFVVLGAIHPRSEITVDSVDASPERTGFLDVLQRMGADIVRHPSKSGAGVEIVARSSTLRATEIHSIEIPSVDEVPALTVAAAAAAGVSAFRDMAELRVKESDRFAGAMDLATRLGCRVWADGDDFFVEGRGDASRFARFEIAAELDHRMVMSAAIAGAAGAGCAIAGAETVASSYPRFFDDLASLR